MTELNNQKAENNSKKSKLSQPKHELQLNITENSNNSHFNSSEPPKLKKSVSNNQLNEKLDKLISDSPTQDSINQLASKQDLESVKRSVSKQNSELHSNLEAKMTAQNSKLLDTAIDTRNIAYSDGLKDNLNGANQRIDALQKRMDNSTRNMSDIAKQNDAMNSDFKQIGQTLNESTKAINNNTSTLVNLMRNGFWVRTKHVTESVANEFQRITGKSIDSFITDAVHQELQKDVNEAKQANNNAQLLVDECRKSVQQNISIVNALAGFINIWLVEFAIILLSTLATPGPWKFLTVIATTSIALLYNSHNRRN